MAVPVTLLALAGAGVGVATGLVPGLHGNTVALVLVAFLGAGASAGTGLGAAAFLVALSVSHTFVSVVPATFLGAPDADAAVQSLPGHDLVHEGRGVEAVHLSARGSAWGVAGGLLLAFPLAWAWRGPWHVAEGLRVATPWLLLALAAFLVVSERRRVPTRRVRVVEPGAGGRVQGVLARREGVRLHLEDGRELRDPLGWLEDVEPGTALEAETRWTWVPGRLGRVVGWCVALLVLVLSALVGWVAFRGPSVGLWGWRGSLLFPALTGLFGVPALLLAGWASGDPPRQQPVAEATTRLGEEAGPCLRGSLWGSLVGLLPGVTAGHATVLALLSDGDAGGDGVEAQRERVLLALSATNTAGAVLAWGLWAAGGPARTGVLAGVEAVWPAVPWPAGAVVPPSVLRLAQAVLLGGIVGFLATRRVGGALARWVHRVPARRVSTGVLLLLAGLVVLFTGGFGVVVLAVASLVGVLPWVAGVRRTHCMGVILGPVLWMHRTSLLPG